MRNRLVTFGVGVIALLSLFSIAGISQNKGEAAKEGDRDFCSNNNWNGDRASVSEEREMTVTATGSLAVDGAQNGGIKVTGSDRADVSVRACVQAWGKTDEEAKAIAQGVNIGSGSVIKAENSSSDKNWSVSYQISVPRSTNLDLKAHNGGISIKGVSGTLQFETANGGVRLADVAGDVKGRTVNGGINVTLAGDRWNGNGIDVQTTNGGVMLVVPQNFAAHVEAGTVNGGFKSDFPALNVDRSERSKPAKVSADLNGGGPLVRVVTVNGGVRISTTDKSEKE